MARHFTLTNSTVSFELYGSWLCRHIRRLDIWQCISV